MTEQLTKDKSRQRWSELRDLLNEWDFIGVANDHPTEYDCLIGSLMRRLEQGQSKDELSRFLAAVTGEHFGLDSVQGIEEFVAKAKAWFDSSWNGTSV